MIEKRAQRRTDHRLAGNVTILLWHIAAGALAPSARDNDAATVPVMKTPCSSLAWL